MPTCPGCERNVPYRQLPIHERYCDGIWSDEQTDSGTVKRIDQRLTVLEKKVDRRLREIETDLERPRPRSKRYAREVAHKE